MANANCPIPNNINPLSPTGFLLSISKLPDVSYFAQEVTLPDVSLPGIDVNTPLARISQPGEYISYGDLTINFLVDEGMKNYMAIYDWVKGLGFPQTHKQYTDFIEAERSNNNTYNRSENLIQYSDGTLAVLGSNNTTVKAFKFIDLHPISLGSLQFVANATDVNYLIGSATFKYTYFEVE